MDPRILKRIEELKERLYALRAHRLDSTTVIAIQAIEQELSQTAARLPREWDMILNREPQDSVKSPSPADDRTQVLKVGVAKRRRARGKLRKPLSSSAAEIGTRANLFELS